MYTEWSKVEIKIASAYVVVVYETRGYIFAAQIGAINKVFQFIKRLLFFLSGKM